MPIQSPSKKSRHLETETRKRHLEPPWRNVNERHGTVVGGLQPIHTRGGGYVKMEPITDTIFKGYP